MTELQVARGVLDVWAATGGGRDDDRLTQALLGCPATVLEERGAWARVQLPDYAGWVERAALAPAAEAAGAEVLVITTRGAPLYAAPDSAQPFDEAYLGTVLPLVDAAGARLAVALPGPRVAWIDAAAGPRRPAALPLPPLPAAATIDVARGLLGCPYLWGGGTYRGIDCSALTQRAYALCGHTIPRDADQQRDALDRFIARDALQPGDLLFFGRGGEITHVTLSLGGPRFIQSLGAPSLGVCIQSIDPAADDYNAPLDAIYLDARRVVV